MKRDIQLVASIVRVMWGVGLGSTLFTFTPYAYGLLGGDEHALTLSVVVFAFLQLCILSLEVPTGALGDHLGRRKTVILACGIYALCFLVYMALALSSNVTVVFGIALFSAFCYAVCYTLLSGSLVAWIVDSLRERQVAEGPNAIMARAHAHGYLGILVGTLVSVPCYLYDAMMISFLFGFISCAVGTFLCRRLMKESASLTFHTGPFTFQKSFQRMKEIMVMGSRITLRTPALLYIMLPFALVMFLVHTVNLLWPIAMRDNFGMRDMSRSWFLLVALVTLSMYYGSKISSRIKAGIDNSSLWAFFNMLILLMAVPVVILAVASRVTSLSLAVFGFVIVVSQFAFAALRPIYETLVNIYIPVEHSQERATIMSLGSMMAGVITAALILFSKGPNGEATTTGWLLPSGLLIVVITVINLLMRKYQRRVTDIATSSTV